MIHYEEESLASLLSLPFRLKGSVGLKASWFAVPSALLAILLVMSDEIFEQLDPEIGWWLRDAVGLADQSQISFLWAASTSVLVLLLGFRTNRAMARFWEGTGLLHQMRGEWFDSVSCCVTFSRGANKNKPQQVLEFRHTIVRLMSLCHGYALEEISPSDSEDLETIDTMGLDDNTLAHLQQCKSKLNFNRVEVVLHLIQSLIIVSLDEGVITVAPPILSRVYQTLSRGFVNLLNAKKIADTRFPFPYAQTIAVLLFVNTVLTPVLMSILVDSIIWAPIFTFMPIFGMFSLNFIGVELENPFGDDANDLPLYHFQKEMNKCLMMLLQENADLLPGVSDKRCVKDFQALRCTLGPSQHRISSTMGQVDQPDGELRTMRTSRLSSAHMFDPETDGEHVPDDNFFLSDISEDKASEGDANRLAELLPGPGKGGPPDIEELFTPFDPGIRPTEPVVGKSSVTFRTACSHAEVAEATPPVVAAVPPDLPPGQSAGGESLFLCLGRALRELQRLLDDELLQDLARSAGSLKLFCDAIATTVEALPRDQYQGNGASHPPACLPEPASNDDFLWQGHGLIAPRSDEIELERSLRAADAGSDSSRRLAPAKVAARLSADIQSGRALTTGGLPDSKLEEV